MQATIELDNQLMERAGLITGIKERTAIIHAGLKALIEHRNAQGDGSAPGADARRIERATSDETFDSPAKKQHRQQQAAEALAAMRALQGKIHIGRKLTREEMNER